jgi:hypothetical protein
VQKIEEVATGRNERKKRPFLIQTMAGQDPLDLANVTPEWWDALARNRCNYHNFRRARHPTTLGACLKGPTDLDKPSFESEKDGFFFRFFRSPRVIRLEQELVHTDYRFAKTMQGI